MDNKDNKLIPDEDFEYEKSLAEHERERQQALDAAEQAAKEERKRLEREEKEKRDKQIAQDKIELMKLKNGVIEESESIKEEHSEVRKLKGKEWIANFWYHNKLWICFGVFIAAVIIFITYDTLSREKPDLTVMMIANNGLSVRQDELEEFFEKYTDDLNGDGKVHVSVIIAPLDPNSADTTQSAYQTKWLAQLQTSECIMVITDSNTEEDFLNIMKHDLAKDFDDATYIDEYGLSLNFKFLAEKLKYEYMPNDVHLSMRVPVQTLSDSKEDMEKSYEKSFKVFKRIVEDLTAKAEETNDPGLETEPVRSDSSSDASDTSSDK